MIARLKMTEGAEAIAMKVYNSAKKFHAEAKKAAVGPEKDRRYALAFDYYSSLLDLEYPNILSEAHFYLAEVLYDQNKLESSASHYEAAAMMPGKMQAQAAWNWFLTAEKLADGFQYHGKELKALSAHDENYLKAADLIQSLSGITNDQKIKASYQSARLIYQLNDLDRALPLFQMLAQKYSSSQEGKLSAQLVLDIYNIKKDYKNIAQYARLYKDQVDSSQRLELGQLEQQAQLKEIESAESQAKGLQGPEKTAELEKVAQAYMEFAKSYPQRIFS
jgi:hypothetical protein